MVSIRSFLSLGVTSLLASQVSAIANADALPWAKANPQAAGAAQAFADAYAEAVAIAHPDPEAYAYAASADDCATIACHASCGLLIIAGQDCSDDNSYSGPYNTTCLCSSDSEFMSYYPACMNCGWTLWKYYGGYVSSALAACSTLSTEPTGTLRCSTTLSESYSIDTNIQGCSYLGNCATTTTEESTPTTADATTSSTTLTSSSAQAETGSTGTTAATSTSSSASASTTESTSKGNTSVSTATSESSSEATTSSASAVTSESTSEVSTSTTAAAPTVASSEIASESTSDVAEVASSSVESSATPSATEPTLVGELVDGQPEWTLTVPGTYSPWSAVSLQVSRNGSLGSFQYTDAEVQLNGISQSDASISVTGDSIVLSFDFAVEETDFVSIVFGGRITGGSSFTSSAILSITSEDAKKFSKRAVQTWVLSSTITSDASSSSSSTSTEASTEATVTSTGAYSNGTISTVTTGSASTTVITITSCDANACTEEAVTTGLTVVTTTIGNIVTEYTTYCPLSTTGTVATSSGGASAIAATTTAAATSVDVTSAAKGSTAAASTQSNEAVSTAAAISTYEGKARHIAGGSTILSLLLSFLFI